MPTSEARIRANRENAARSTGPVTHQGKLKSRSNSARHGLSGDGAVLDDDDAVELERRHEALLREMAPKTELGALLVRKIAVTSILSERATRHEFFASAERVRNAPERFDAGRVAEAEALFEALHEDPRGHLRRLRAMPEGVDLMVGAWLDLKAGLTRPERPRWTAAELVKAANLLGVRDEDARGSQIGTITREFWGDFEDGDDREGGAAGERSRKAAAPGRLLGFIDDAIAELGEHAATLDVETIALDRAEAGGRALFDGSKEASLARRYEAEQSRGFYKAIKEFRAVEAEAESRPASPPAPEPGPIPPPESASLGSFRGEEDEDGPWPTEMAPEHLRPVSRAVLDLVPHALDAEGNPFAFTPKPSTPV